jgi:hypothetical protein
MDYEYALTDEEILKYKEFVKRHKECNPEVREALIEETVSSTLNEITLYMTSIGMFPSAKCGVCGNSESIACDEMIESA